jgi:hypothetical protein
MHNPECRRGEVLNKHTLTVRYSDEGRGGPADRDHAAISVLGLTEALKFELIAFAGD